MYIKYPNWISNPNKCCSKFQYRINHFHFLFCYVLNTMWHNKSEHKNHRLCPFDFMNGFSCSDLICRHKIHSTLCIPAYGFNEDVLHCAQWMTKWKHLRKRDIRNKTKQKKRNIQIRDPVLLLILFDFIAKEHAKYVCWAVVTYFNFNCLTDRNHQINSRISKIPREWIVRMRRDGGRGKRLHLALAQLLSFIYLKNDTHT